MGNTYYKEAGNGWIIKLDDMGNKSPSFNKKNRPSLWAEKEAWEAAGGVVEQQYTADEQEAKEALEAEQALESQKSTIERLLRESDHKVKSHTKFPGNVPVWKTFRETLWVMQDSDQLEEIPEKPF